MGNAPRLLSKHPYAEYIERIYNGQTLLPDTPQNVIEVVGILKSYGVVLDAYYKNLIYIAQNQFLELFPFFKYFNGQVNVSRLLQHWWHDRINYEYAEYCMRVMMWHGGGGLDQYLESSDFKALAQAAIAAKIRKNPFIRLVNKAFPDFLLEQVRQLVYYSFLGQFWEVMSPLFLNMAQEYEQGRIQTIPDVVAYIKAGLVAAANQPMVYRVAIAGQSYDIIPPSAGLIFITDAAVPYVEAVFLRGTPFLGTVSYNAQAQQIPLDQSRFMYGALYADPLPIGGAGVPPTLLMQDMRHFIPDYLHRLYEQTTRQEDDLLIKICETFQKSMFCVTNAAIVGLMPHALDSQNPQEQQANQDFLQSWMDHFRPSRLDAVQNNSPW
jgi:CO2 hydration protein